MDIKLSVVIITFNEERNIARCLDSVKDVADDVVVVDSFSTDNTQKICFEKNARFVEHVFEGHIEQKNWAITQAKYPHVLSLDADEAMDARLIQSVKVVKSQWKHDGYIMNRLTNYCGKWIHHSSWYPDRKLRLWDSRKGKWGGTNPHDKYEMEDGSSLGYLEGDILHYSFYEIKDHLNQVTKFSEIAAKAYYEQGRRAPLFRIWISPVFKFFQMYFLKLGFLDGFEGLVIARISANFTFIKYARLRQLNKNKAANG